MFDFEFENIVQDQHDLTLNKGLYLWVFHADKIPPHIGISISGGFYSLKSSGVDVDLNVGKVFQLIVDKKLPSFLIELSHDVSREDVEQVYMNYSKAEAGVVTCLTPVQEVLRVKPVSKLSELLTELNGSEMISKVFGYNLPNGLRGIRAYTSQDITNRLLDLQGTSK